MRKLVAIVVILVSIAVCDTHVRAGDGPQVLLILREGSFFDIELMLTKEVGVMISMLEEAGFEVVSGFSFGSACWGSYHNA